MREDDERVGLADGMNVNYDVYRIKTAITQQGSTIDAGDLQDNTTGRNEAEVRKQKEMIDHSN